MKIGMLGTGIVARTLTNRLIGLGHEVWMGTRDVSKTVSSTAKDNYGGPSFSEWHSSNKQAKVVTFTEAAAFGEIVFNATQGANSVTVLKSAGASALNGKTLIDVSNPLDFSKGMPPILIPELCNTNSLGEEIQRTFPKANVVKSLSTMWCGLMVNPGMLAQGDHNVFVCGNDTHAKANTSDILQQFGWRKESIIDLGDITAARGLEMMLPVWLKLMNFVGNGAFNIKIVR